MKAAKQKNILTVPALAGFLVTFTLALGFVNYYIFERIAAVAGFPAGGLLLYALAVIPAALFILTTWFARKHENRTLRAGYIIASYWLGFTILAFPLLFISDLLAGLIPWLKLKLYLAAFAVSVAASVYASLHALRIRVREITVKAGVNLRLVQVSDAHYGIIHGDGHLDRLVELVNAQNPDIICFTGDLVDGSKVIRRDTFAALRKLKAPAYFITGNHEHFDGLDVVLPAVRAAGVKIMDFRETKVKGIRIAGAGFSFDRKKEKEYINSLKKTNGVTILLCHEPIFYDEAAAKGVRLMLSGHTHAGQVVPFNFLVRAAYKMVRGRHEVGAMTLLVSEGYGTWGPRMRLGSGCELNVINLIK